MGIRLGGSPITAWLRISFRNLLKNRRRSLVTLMAVAMGVAAITLFQGFTYSTDKGLARSAIQGAGLGHL